MCGYVTRAGVKRGVYRVLVGRPAGDYSEDLVVDGGYKNGY